MVIARLRARISAFEDEQRFRDVEMLASRDSAYSVLPRLLAAELGVQPTDRRSVRLRDGTVGTMDLGVVRVEFRGVRGFANVMISDVHENPHLGWIALAGMGFEIDSATGEVRPTEEVLMALAP